VSKEFSVRFSYVKTENMRKKTKNFLNFGLMMKLYDTDDDTNADRK